MSSADTPVRDILDRFAKPRAGEFGVGAGLLLVATALQQVPALVIGVALDALLLESQAYAIPLVPATWIPATRAGQVAFTLGVLAVAVVAESALTWYGRLVYERASLRTLHDLRVATYDTVASLSMAFHDDRDRGDALSVVNDDVDNVADLFAGLRQGLLYGGSVVSAFAYMWLLNWQLALLLLAIPLVLVATGRVYASLLEPRYDAVRASVGRVNVRVQDAIHGLPTVKAFTREDTERDRVADASADYKDAKWSALRLQMAYDALSWFLGTVGIWGLFLVGGYWILQGPPLGFTAELSAGSLLTFLIYAESFLDPTRRLAVQVVNQFESGQASCRRVAGVLDHDASTHHDATTDDENTEVDVTEGRVAYDDVSFSYATDDEAGDQPTIDAVSFDADPGEFVGVVGSTGAGKSTLLKLLFDFYEPDSGTVRVDGHDVASVDTERLREDLGYVSQEPFLFPGTVAENVAYATPDADRDAVVAAAKRAGAHEFVTDLPDGYDTPVGERGASLSGGQRQRLAIARALFHDPAVLVLDEATSHVDNETEAAIQRSLEAMAGDQTVFAIAHRLATVRDADRILVLDDGELVEDGTHDELLARDGRYARLWRIQTGAVAAGGEPPAVEEVSR